MKIVVAALLLVEISTAAWPALREANATTATAEPGRVGDGKANAKSPRCEDTIADVLQILAGEMK